jgi:nicotinamide mononucleotide transporter
VNPLTWLFGSELVIAGFYPSAVLYGFYGAFCVVGFRAWLRAGQRPPSVNDPTVETVGA